MVRLHTPGWIRPAGDLPDRGGPASPRAIPRFSDPTCRETEFPVKLIAVRLWLQPKTTWSSQQQGTASQHAGTPRARSRDGCLELRLLFALDRGQAAVPVKRVRCRSVLRRRGTRCSHWGRGHKHSCKRQSLYGRLPLTTGGEQQFRTGFTGNIDLCQSADMRRLGTSAGGAECLAGRTHLDAARFTWNMLESRDHPADCTAGVLRPHTRVRTLVISTPCVGLLAQLPVKRAVLRRRSPLARCRRPPRPASRETDTKKLAAHSIRSAKHE